MEKLMFLPPLLVLQLALPDVFTHVHELRYIVTRFDPPDTMLKVYNGLWFRVLVQNLK